jgi:hypothetical protein
VAWRRQYAEVAGRVIRREANDVANAAGRFSKRGSLTEFEAWLDEFYTEHRVFTAKAFRPVAWSYGDLIAAEVAAELEARALAGAEGAMAVAGELRDLPAQAEPFSGRYISAYADRHVAKSKAEIRATVARAQAEGAPWFEALEAELEGWREKRPDQIAGAESVRFGNALAVALYTYAGIRRLRWVAIGESCPYCNHLNGRIVGIRDPFLTGGTELNPDGAERPLKVVRNVRHAPAHSGCDCVTMAA